MYKCCLQALAEANENSEKYKQQTETLKQQTETMMNKQSLMLQEKEMLNEQRLEQENKHREALARAHTVLLTQKSEIDAARVKEEALQSNMRQLEERVSELQSMSDMWSGKEQHFHSQLTLAGKREGQCSAILDRTSNKFLVTVLAKPVFTEWKDLACDARARRWTLYSLLCGIMGGLRRRFRKNHFLQWKLYTKTVQGFCDSKVAIIRLQVLVDVFQAWATLPHMSAHERREMELKTKADAAKTAADDAIKALTEKSTSKLAVLANELRVSRQHLYEAEQDKEAIRAKAAQDTAGVVKTLERELQQSAEKEKQLVRDFQSQLAAKFSDEQVAEVKQQLSEEHKAKMSKLEEKYKAAASIASQTHSEELDKLNKIRQELEHQNSIRISALESQHQDAMRKAAQAHSTEIQNLKKLQQDQEKQNKLALAGAHGQHKAALDSTLQAERKAFFSTKSELEEQLQVLKAQFSKALEERKATEDRSRSTVMELENKNKVEVAKLHFKLQQREAQLNDELQRAQVTSSKVYLAPLSRQIACRRRPRSSSRDPLVRAAPSCSELAPSCSRLGAARATLLSELLRAVIGLEQLGQQRRARCSFNVH